MTLGIDINNTTVRFGRPYRFVMVGGRSYVGYLVNYGINRDYTEFRVGVEDIQTRKYMLFRHSNIAYVDELVTPGAPTQGYQAQA